MKQICHSCGAKESQQNTPALPDAIIIVNTQNVDTGMIISRRTTYQRILAIEKEGVQIFEGEIRFLYGIMDSLDELYVVVASLGIDLQLFCSHSSEISDEIILNSIAHAAKSTRGVSPKMSESETLAESFLSKFPSLNPISAHAIF
nr:protein shortage in chiasmata 1 [Tanacetum cinerariifolium]